MLLATLALLTLITFGVILPAALRETRRADKTGD